MKSDIHRMTPDELEQYVLRMPDEYADAVRRAQAEAEKGTTYDQRRSVFIRYDALRSIWLDLSEQLSASVFGGLPAGAFFDEMMQQRGQSSITDWRSQAVPVRAGPSSLNS